MKLKKFLKGLFAFVFAVTMAFNFTACSENDDIITIITYTANGNMSASSSDAWGAMFAIPEYNEAIAKVLGDNYTTTEMDKEVISACDAVFKNHRTNHPSWKGAVEIEKSKIGTYGEIVSSSVIKTYIYE